MKMRVCIIDDDHLVSLSLKTILEADGQVEIVGIGSSGEDAIRFYEEKKPDVLLMDIRMAAMTGLEAASAILNRDPSAKILLLTTFSDDEYIVKALQAGAKGYLLKQDYTSLLPALSAVASGQTVFGCEVVSKLPGLFRKAEDFDYAAAQISTRELEIIRLVADGLSNKEIASELFLSEGTVRNYLSDILDKLNLRDRTQVAVFYYQHQSNTP